MSYQPLARKYRPAKFGELVGQDTVSTALTNAVRLEREPHGIIFSGVRGVGKTTIARLYAKLLNCSHRVEGEPCGECSSCLAITSGTHEDVIEIDGASNTSVDDVRSLQETIGYVPQRSAYKIYIIDEVHMLSQSAFNALLKTLEEPPQHVVFIFATTELIKVPQTIVSRCQTFFLRKIPVVKIMERLKEVLDYEQVSYEEKALFYIAREGHGSLRDAMTMLDQVIALGGGEVRARALQGYFASASATPYLKLLDAMLRRDSKECIKALESLDESGVDLDRAVEETAKIARHAFILKSVGTDSIEAGLLGMDDQELHDLGKIAENARPLDLNRMFRTLVACLKDLDGSEIDRFIAENCVLEWCLDPGLPMVDDLVNLFESNRQQLGTASKGARSPLNQSTPAISRKTLRNLSAELKSGEQKPVVAPRQPNPTVGHKIGPESSEHHAPSQDEKESAMPPPPNPVASATAGEYSNAVLEPTEPAEKIQTHRSQPEFPVDWRGFVDAWKKAKPLQARKLEEVRCIEYGEKRILLKVDPKSLAATSLVKPEEKAKLAGQFAEVFGFSGSVEIVYEQQDSSDHAGCSPKEESILDMKKKEQKERHQRYEQDARKDPFIQDLVGSLGAKIERVEITGSSDTV